MTAPLLSLSLLLAACGDPPDVDSADDSAAVDLDGDGFAADEDCDDTDPEVSPDADERCDGVDNDCDGLIDDEDDSLSDAQVFYADADGDGFGDPGAELVACALPEGAADNALDCEDADGAVHPEADELCDDVDNDCDGLIDDEDEGVLDASVWFSDLDGDGFADPQAGRLACTQPEDTLPDPGEGGPWDCDDAADSVYPGAAELCDGIDSDCDGVEAAGIASFQGEDGAWADVTVDLAGDPSSPAAVTLSDPGALWICEGTWYVNLNMEADVDVLGFSEGDAPTLHGGDVGSVLRFQTDGTSHSVRGLTLTHGQATEASTGTSHTSGGGLLCDAEVTLALSDLDFFDNRAGNGAGARFTGLCEASVADSRFEGGVATYGGGVSVAGGAHVELEDVDFTDNASSNSSGGGALRLGAEGSLSAAGGTWSGNSSPRGGAYYNNGGEVALTEVTLQGNVGTAHGGAIYTKGVDTLIDCEITDNTTSGNGGGLTSHAATVTLDGVLLDGNSCTGAECRGGGLYVGGGTELSAMDTVISDNISAYVGGGVSVYEGDVDFEAVELSGNSASDFGGGLIVFSSGRYVSSQDLIEGNTARDGGGALIVGEAVMEGATISSNTATSEGGGVNVWVTGEWTATSTVVSGNSPDEVTTYYGGVADPAQSASDFTCDDGGCE